jgi:uncharacterized protein YhfF
LVDQSGVCEFGFPGPLRDRLVAAVLSGAKTATSALQAEWDVDGASLPKVGDQQIVIDSAGLAVARIEITDCRVIALSKVDDAIARAEGEAYSTAAGWRAEHERFWRDEVLPQWEGSDPPTISDETPVVVQWFRVMERL